MRLHVTYECYHKTNKYIHIKYNLKTKNQMTIKKNQCMLFHDHQKKWFLIKKA